MDLEKKKEKLREKPKINENDKNSFERRFSLETSKGSWLLREKRKRKRTERRAAKFKELRENGVNKIFPFARVKARPREARKGVWQIEERRR